MPETPKDARAEVEKNVPRLLDLVMWIDGKKVGEFRTPITAKTLEALLPWITETLQGAAK